MDRVTIAKELVLVARSLVADVDLDRVVQVVRGNSFLSLRGPLHMAGFKKVDFGHEGGSHWSIKTRGGKTIIVTSKKNVDAMGANDVEVGDFVVGYL